MMVGVLLISYVAALAMSSTCTLHVTQATITDPTEGKFQNSKSLMLNLSSTFFDIIVNNMNAFISL